MKVSDFTFAPELIAQRPSQQRDHSRLRLTAGPALSTQAL